MLKDKQAHAISDHLFSPGASRHLENFTPEGSDNFVNDQGGSFDLLFDSDDRKPVDKSKKTLQIEDLFTGSRRLTDIPFITVIDIVPPQ
jgi:hypothetical protein